MKCDLNLLARAIGKSEEEAYLSLHCIICSMANQLKKPPVTGETYSATLDTKEDRSTWEYVVSNMYIGHVLQNVEQELERATLSMAEDAELGNELVSVAIFEKDRPPKTLKQPLYLTPFLWRYQSRPSLIHLKGIVQGMLEQGDNTSHPVLTEFITAEHKLRPLIYLPDIIELQLALKRLFHLRISRNNTNKGVNACTRISEFLNQEGDGTVKIPPRLKECLASLARAWKQLKTPMLEKDLSGMKINNDYLQSDEDVESMPLSAILPAPLENGTWSLSMCVVEALVTIQNQFLRWYAEAKGFNLSSSGQVVRLTDVAQPHVIAFDVEMDLEPLVTIHCDYSLGMGEGTHLKYNFHGLERQIITKFIQGKSLIQRETILFTYGDSVCGKAVFTRLRRVIPQTEISSQLENEIVAEFRERLSLPDLHTSLRALDLAISILHSSGGDPDQYIHMYLTEALRLRENDGLLSEKARKTCTLSNILSLWQICEVEKARLLIEGGLDPFEDIQMCFKHDIPHAEKCQLERNTLRKFSINDLECISKSLYEFITLELRIGVQRTFLLHEPLRFRIASFLSEGSRVCDDIPDDVLLKHVVGFWKCVNGHIAKEKKVYS